MGRSTSDYGTEPYVVFSEDGSSWINVEDVHELEWLMKEKQLLMEKANAIVKSDKKRSVRGKQQNQRDVKDLHSPPENTENVYKHDKNDKKQQEKLPCESGDFSDSEKATQVFRVVSDIIDRLRSIKQRLSDIQSSHSMMYEQYAIYHKKPPVVKNSDGSRWFNVENVDEVDEILGVKKTVQKEPSKPDVFVGDITKLQVVAENIGQSKRDKKPKNFNEKIVCVEYDVFTKNVEEPIKKMRAFLALKSPSCPKSTKGGNPKSPSKYNSNMKLTEEEIRMIDAEIKEKKGYLDELRSVLKTKPNLQIKHNRAISTCENTLQNKQKSKDYSNLTVPQPSYNKHLTKSRSNINKTTPNYYSFNTEESTLIPPLNKDHYSPKSFFDKYLSVQKTYGKMQSEQKRLLDRVISTECFFDNTQNSYNDENLPEPKSYYDKGSSTPTTFLERDLTTRRSYFEEVMSARKPNYGKHRSTPKPFYGRESRKYSIEKLVSRTDVNCGKRLRNSNNNCDKGVFKRKSPIKDFTRTASQCMLSAIESRQVQVSEFKKLNNKAGSTQDNEMYLRYIRALKENSFKKNTNTVCIGVY